MATPKQDPLDPSHLRQPDQDPRTDDDLRASASPTPAKKVDDAKTAAMRQRVYTFEFDYTAANGDVFRGMFTSTVAGVRAIQQIGIMRAQLANGIPYDAMDPETRTLNFIHARLTFILDVDARPAWAKDLRSVVDVNILHKLHEEVSLHEATFLGAR